MISEKIKILLIKRKMTLGELAGKVGTSPQNMSNKLRRDNFSYKEMQSVSSALGCKLCIAFEIDETGEKI